MSAAVANPAAAPPGPYRNGREDLSPSSSEEALDFDFSHWSRSDLDYLVQELKARGGVERCGERCSEEEWADIAESLYCDGAWETPELRDHVLDEWGRCGIREVDPSLYVGSFEDASNRFAHVWYNVGQIIYLVGDDEEVDTSVHDSYRKEDGLQYEVVELDEAENFLPHFERIVQAVRRFPLPSLVVSSAQHADRALVAALAYAMEVQNLPSSADAEALYRKQHQDKDKHGDRDRDRDRESGGAEGGKVSRTASVLARARSSVSKALGDKIILSEELEEQLKEYERDMGRRSTRPLGQLLVSSPKRTLSDGPFSPGKRVKAQIQRLPALSLTAPATSGAVSKELSPGSSGLTPVLSAQLKMKSSSSYSSSSRPVSVPSSFVQAVRDAEKKEQQQQRQAVEEASNNAQKKKDTGSAKRSSQRSKSPSPVASRTRSRSKSGSA